MKAKGQVTKDKGHERAARVTRHLSPVTCLRLGFTLIELMVAIAIGALMMMIAIPAMRAARKPPLVRAVNDFLEACREARSRAILTGLPMQVAIVVNDRTTELHVERAPSRGLAPLSGPETGPASSAGADMASKPLFRAELPEDVAFRPPLLINLSDAMAGANNAAVIRFYPNGTCDSLDAVLQWQRREAQRITSELVTGYMHVEAAP